MVSKAGYNRILPLAHEIDGLFPNEPFSVVFVYKNISQLNHPNFIKIRDRIVNADQNFHTVKFDNQFIFPYISSNVSYPILVYLQNGLYSGMDAISDFET
jgi:hypothetical protein